MREGDAPAPAQAETRGGGTVGLTPAAFASRFEEASRALWCIAAGVLGSPDQADDVLQDAASIALTKLAEFDPETNFGAWMGRIVRYVALNTMRKRNRRRSVVASAGEAIESMSVERPPRPRGDIAVDGSIADDQGSFDDHMLAALDQLDPTARACLLLRTIRDLSYREIANLLDIPEGTAMSHVHRSRSAMRGLLANSSLVSAPGGSS
jgi:RNA polymerase sigma-70 factor (ECF subfamily)